MLPYTSVGDAMAALGRPLTPPELAWLRLTAIVPDALLYYLNIVFLFIAFNLASLPTLLLDLLLLLNPNPNPNPNPDPLKPPASAADPPPASSAASFHHPYKIQPSVHVPASSLLECYKTVMRTFFTVVLPLQIFSYPAVKVIGIRTSLPLPSAWEIVAQITVYSLLQDYIQYWIHRWLHSEWGYNNIHYMHHEYTAPSSVAAVYAHWAEILLLAVPSFLGPALVPCHMVTLWLWIVLQQLESIDAHSGYEFPWSPAKWIPFYGGSEYHDYHHFVGGNCQNNFASLFTYCDYIYGTNKGYLFKKKSRESGKKERCQKRRLTAAKWVPIALFGPRIPGKIMLVSSS